MPIIVQKYGGSSVADVEKVQQVARKVVAAKQAGDDVVVVVSAMAGSTDRLLALARQIDDAPPRRELDMLLSTGERVSMALLSMAIQKLGCDAISFTGSQSGIITNDRHFDAKIIEVRPWRIEDELARDRVVIVAGYQGMSYKREVTTLGRGGSDTTAIALAAALGAERAEIYSDVDGVYSADPRTVPDARHLPDLGYSEMQEMADSGAKVLNAEAVEFARKARITIHARSTFAPGRETLVRETSEGSMTAVVGRKCLALLDVYNRADREVALSLCHEHRLEVEQLYIDGERTTLLLPTEGPGYENARRMFAVNLGQTQLVDSMGSVTVVGKIVDQSRWVAEALGLLRGKSVDIVRVLTQRRRICFIIPEQSVDVTSADLHRLLPTPAS